jgi:hypothetical protein
LPGEPIHACLSEEGAAALGEKTTELLVRKIPEVLLDQVRSWSNHLGFNRLYPRFEQPDF